jgi:hypothetical protein
MKLALDQYALDARYTAEPHVLEFAMRSDTYMESDSGKRAKESGVRDRRYSIRYPFAADAEMLELESGTRVSGVTSDLSLGGCFVCARRTLETGVRVRATLTHQGQKVKMLAVVRVVKPQVGVGLEFLDIDRDSNAALLAWIENLRKSR